MFFPKKTKIFDKLEKQSGFVQRAAELFYNIAHDMRQLDALSTTMKQLEQEADKLVHTIIEEVEKTFILPLDKEDITELTDAMDDVIDYLEETVNRIEIFRMTESSDALKEFSGLIKKASGEITKGIMIIKNRGIASNDFDLCGINIRELETRGDALHRKILEDLMNYEAPYVEKENIISIIKWKEIYQILEDTLDRCDNIAKIFSKLKIKYV